MNDSGDRWDTGQDSLEEIDRFKVVGHNPRRVDALKDLAAGIGISTAQLALAWCLRRPNISSVIVGATRIEQLEENVKAVGIELPSDISTAIDDLFPGPAVRAGTEADD